MIRMLACLILAAAGVSALQEPELFVRYTAMQPDSEQYVVEWLTLAKPPAGTTVQEVVYFAGSFPPVQHFRDPSMRADTVWFPRDTIAVEGSVLLRFLATDSVAVRDDVASTVVIGPTMRGPRFLIHARVP